MLSNNKLTTDRFIVFLIILKKFLEENNYFEFKRIIILDNLSSHRTDKVLNMLLKCNFYLCYIPPYSLFLAPVEHTFGILKRKHLQKQKEK